MDTKPLLSICIPTYNRDKILKLALEKLLPQINKYKDLIEIIISDNASTDNTQLIIEEFTKKFCDLNFVLFKHKENTGYFGNFKKCRELSKGKYFWLLSDDDHLNNSVLDLVMEILLHNDDISGIYLHNLNYLSDFFYEKVNFDEIKTGHRKFALMLISSVIMYNNKIQDSMIFQEFKGNDFLGFLFFIQSLKYSKKIVVLRGNIFTQISSPVSFDIFKSWIEDIMQCISFIEKERLLSKEQINFIVNGFLERVVVHHVHRYITYGNILGKNYGSLRELRNRMDKFYFEYEYYNECIRPLFFMNRTVLLIKDLYKRFKKKIITNQI